MRALVRARHIELDNKIGGKMWLTFLGAAGTVTGSRHMIDHGGHRLLLDCGMFQGGHDLRLRNWARFPFPGGSIDAVIVSHAHLDHVGWLPRLVADGFTGPIYATTHTSALAALVLRDAAHLQEEDAAYAARKGFSKHTPPLPLYSSDDAEKTIAQFTGVGYGESFEPMPDVLGRLHPAGHILGSATVEVRAGGRTLVYSGDLGRPDHPLLRPPDPPSAADTIVVESTYGDRPRRPVSLDRFATAVASCLHRGGTVLIPAFAVDRTEVVLQAIQKLVKAGRIPRVPIWVDSPMAAAVLAIYRDAIVTGATELRTDLAPDPFGTDNLHVARSIDESKLLNAPAMPCIVISAAGMVTGGRVVHHLSALAPDPRNLIVLAGFQVPGTRGRELLDGATAVKAHGRYIQVRAPVLGLDEFSCHADADQLIDWLRSAPRGPDTCFAVHGEATAAAALARRIHDELDWCAAVAHHAERVWA